MNTKCSPDSAPTQSVHTSICFSVDLSLPSFLPLSFSPLSKLALWEYRFRKSKGRTLSLLSPDEWVSLTMTLANATKKLLSGCGSWVRTELSYQLFFDVLLQKLGNRGDLRAISFSQNSVKQFFPWKSLYFQWYFPCQCVKNVTESSFLLTCQCIQSVPENLRGGVFF